MSFTPYFYSAIDKQKHDYLQMKKKIAACYLNSEVRKNFNLMQSDT